MAKYQLQLENLDDADQSSIAGLRDNYPADEYAMQIWMKDNNIEVGFIMRDEIAEELGRDNPPVTFALAPFGGQPLPIAG